MADMINDTRPVREGEQLDLEQLGAYLRTHLPVSEGTSQDLEVAQFPGGHSNLTYLVRWGGKEYVLRRPPYGSKVKTAHDMGREYRVLSKLAPIYDRVPRAILFCDDHAVLGADFYLMERLRGVILRRDPPSGLHIDEAMARRLSTVLIDCLAGIHSIDYQAAGLGDFGKPVGYVTRQVNGWTKRYAASQTDDIAAVDAVAQWLAEHLPRDGQTALLHNDFKFDNLVLDPDDITRVRGVLDWEMSTLGDPLMDLGSTLCYWVQPGDPPLLEHIRFGPTNLPGMMTRAQLVDRYIEVTGRDVSDKVFYYCFGLFKTAVVAQQIYYRYKNGLTRDERFASMILGVRGLAEHAQGVLDRGTI